MCIEYNECHYGGMYNVYVKRIFLITEIVRMNAGVSSEKERVKESQSRSVTPPLDTHYRVPGWGRHRRNAGKGENEGKGVGFFTIQKPALGVPVL